MKGLMAGLRYEAAFRQEFLLFAAVIPIVFLLDFTVTERLALIGSVLAVMVVELVNSAIECTLDRVSIEMHPLAGRAKDYGSLAVLITLMFAIAVWASLILPKLIN
ncbi:diacylglycerol kinase [Methylophaga sp.]|uniref:diacylglycerol kinase n=1 Tax=Methylophaga sp. TaxID=2024840 RepID=UPI0025F91B23|nr:diacylglycerol kinase [Methylophaga sp.]